MRLIKIGLANVNTTVGAFRSNTDKVIERANEMVAARCAVGCFQEQVIGGYPAEDLVQWRTFVDAQWRELRRFAKATKGLATPTVFVLGMTAAIGGNLYNCAAVVCGGRILGLVPKEKLPTYGVFYENRTFSRGLPGFVAEFEDAPFGDVNFRFPFGTLGVEVCEDIWSPDGPMRRRAYSGAELIVNISASPWRAGVTATRREMISTRAGDNNVVIAYVNQVGGNDSLVFDGGGFVNQNGRMLCEAPRWRETLTFQAVDLDRTARIRRENTTWRTDCEEFLKARQPVPTVDADGPRANGPGLQYPVPANRSFFMPAHVHGQCPLEEYFKDLVEAMIMGLDYWTKTNAFKRIGVALSGGKDSVLTTLIAWEFARRKMLALPEEDRPAFMRDFVQCFSMPTRYNSEATKGISRRLCEALGVGFSELSVEEAFGRELEAARAMLGPDKAVPPTTVQNIQARIRGERMWNWANGAQAMWLQTSNMSEKAVGYTTIGGDMMGAYSLIANLPKTVIIELLRYLADRYAGEDMPELAEVLRELLATKASAELAENQADEDDLMPFPVLDACFYLFAGEKMEPVEVYEVVRTMFGRDFPDETLRGWVMKFVRLFQGSIFKWVQTPQSVHLGSLDLDRERALQLPVVQSREWLYLESLEPERRTPEDASAGTAHEHPASFEE
jgi:NAD+ synthase (glutamine-hydrolysing)